VCECVRACVLAKCSSGCFCVCAQIATKDEDATHRKKAKPRTQDNKKGNTNKLRQRKQLKNPEQDRALKSRGATK